MVVALVTKRSVTLERIGVQIGNNPDEVCMRLLSKVLTVIAVTPHTNIPKGFLLFRLSLFTCVNQLPLPSSVLLLDSRSESDSVPGLYDWRMTGRRAIGRRPLSGIQARLSPSGRGAASRRQLPPANRLAMMSVTFVMIVRVSLRISGSACVF